MRRPLPVVVLRLGTGPAHLARGARSGYRLACRTAEVAEPRCTVMSRTVWVVDPRDRRAWRHCSRCDARAARARTDDELFA